MNKLLTYIVLLFFIAFLESILHSAGLFSIAIIVSVLLSENDRSWLSVIFIVLLSIIIDASYFNLLGTYFFSFVIIMIVHGALKRLLPYDNIFVKFPVMIITFLIFHVFLFLFSKYFGQGSSASIDIGPMVLKSFFETIVYSGLSYMLGIVLTNNLTSGQKVRL